MNAVLPVIKVDSSTGAITDNSGKSIEAKVFSFATSALIGTLSTLSGQNAGTYLVYKDDYIPKVATVNNVLGEKSYS